MYRPRNCHNLPERLRVEHRMLRQNPLLWMLTNVDSVEMRTRRYRPADTWGVHFLPPRITNPLKALSYCEYRPLDICMQSVKVT